jgi:diketogulonate reductase-like aldo/keto reductase
MGCASLGSRYDAAQGLRRLAEAFDLGVTWFDVAPAYGGGQAEPILGRFLKGRRDKVCVTTKVGLTAPRQNALKRLAYPILRPIVARAKGLRRAIRGSGAMVNVHVPLTAELIEQSIVRSLQRLGTDRVEVYALHDPSPEDVVREDVLRALETVVARGQARYVSAAGQLNVALIAAAGGRFPVVQMRDDPQIGSLDQVRAAAQGPIALVSHSILGVDGPQAELTARLAADPEAKALAAAAGYDGAPGRVAADILMARAFAANPNGVVLASMFGAGHLASNHAVARKSVDFAALQLAAKLGLQA